MSLIGSTFPRSSALRCCCGTFCAASPRFLILGGGGGGGIYAPPTSPTTQTLTFTLTPRILFSTLTKQSYKAIDSKASD